MTVANIKEARKKCPAGFLLVPAVPGTGVAEYAPRVIVESEADNKRRAPRGAGKEVRVRAQSGRPLWPVCAELPSPTALGRGRAHVCPDPRTHTARLTPPRCPRHRMTAALARRLHSRRARSPRAAGRRPPTVPPPLRLPRRWCL